MHNRLNKTLSFDPDSLMCVTCAMGKHPALKSDAGGRIVLVGTDQCFPACSPSGDGGESMRIVRVEDGTLQDIMYTLADVVGSNKLEDGSVILLGSTSYLGEVGTAQYLSDWCKSRWWLKTRLGEGCHIIPLVPVPATDVKGVGLVRALLETLTWFGAQNATETVLVRSILGSFVDSHIRQGTGTGNLNGRQCFRVPAGLDTRTSVSLVSEGWGVRPDGIPAMSKGAEEGIVLSRIAMLNNAFGLGLSSSICFDCTGTALADARRELSKRQLVAVAGASNAARLATALRATGIPVVTLKTPGWKITKQSVEQLVNELVNLSLAPDIIVLQCLDNSAFFVQNEDGTLTLP